jgi:hypothetical protein
MIVKFKDYDTWVVFGEVDHVEYKDIDFDPERVGLSSDTCLYRPTNDQAAIGKWVKIRLFTKFMNEATEIIACSPIYLMNDQGRTVETI